MSDINFQVESRCYIKNDLNLVFRSAKVEDKHGILMTTDQTQEHQRKSSLVTNIENDLYPIHHLCRVVMAAFPKTIELGYKAYYKPVGSDVWYVLAFILSSHYVCCFFSECRFYASCVKLDSTTGDISVQLRMQKRLKRVFWTNICSHRLRPRTLPLPKGEV